MKTVRRSAICLQLGEQQKSLVVKITHLSPAEVPMNGPKPA
jgi:hypothetical protein